MFQLVEHEIQKFKHFGAWLDDITAVKTRIVRYDVAHLAAIIQFRRVFSELPRVGKKNQRAVSAAVEFFLREVFKAVVFIQKFVCSAHKKLRRAMLLFLYYTAFFVSARISENISAKDSFIYV